MATPRRHQRPLSPTTQATYLNRLRLAYGRERGPFGDPVVDLREWSAPMRAQLRAALTRFAPERLGDMPEEPWQPKRAIVPPTEEDLQQFETQAERVEPAQRALLLLLLGLGLRAFELLNMTRKAAERAHGGEDLLVFRKGGRERFLACDNVRPLFGDLLEQKWTYAWQLLSKTTERAAYRKLHRLIRTLGSEAAKLRPHKLRHGFATRMARAGATLPQIQIMMDHSTPEMTARYVHPEQRDVVRFLQPMERKKKR